MINYGEDIAYAETRLKDSLVLWKEPSGSLHPFLVSSIVCHTTCVFSGFLYGQPKEVFLKDLVVDPVRLGFCEHNGSASYLARVPQRKWRQGLRSYNMKSLNNKGVPSIESISLTRTIKGVYPKIKTCIDYISQGEVKSMAFSRNFAIRPGTPSKSPFIIFDKFGRKVGDTFGDDNNFEVKLLDKFSYYQEMLEESL